MEYIKAITAEETYEVRHPVLRPGKPIETCRFEGDDRASTKHFGLFVDHKLAGIVTLLAKMSPLFETLNQFQLRGMAVLEAHRNKGFGVALVKHSEEYIQQKGGALIWFNARIVAVPFYKKLGYETVGDAFNISDVGQHFVMYKTITD
jgi:GNAT superfamily N-acetyltransferase